ncbi:hypothetical protein PIIN_10454 [Serendipita indica DSM 11827]|uniref:Uncharacterized protein n=1 Tax=Serendipita indica (strain DSM 11827) TaxID=1109443 RepID=G4TYR8_SERID|nr:hypothetical protein PIIN_10454 [Serendipita indica DSM 11827]
MPEDENRSKRLVNDTHPQLSRGIPGLLAYCADLKLLPCRLDSDTSHWTIEAASLADAFALRPTESQSRTAAKSSLALCWHLPSDMAR